MDAGDAFPELDIRPNSLLSTTSERHKIELGKLSTQKRKKPSRHHLHNQSGDHDLFRPPSVDEAQRMRQVKHISDDHEEEKDIRVKAPSRGAMAPALGFPALFETGMPKLRPTKSAMAVTSSQGPQEKPITDWRAELAQKRALRRTSADATMSSSKHAASSTTCTSSSSVAPSRLHSNALNVTTSKAAQKTASTGDSASNEQHKSRSTSSNARPPATKPKPKPARKASATQQANEMIALGMHCLDASHRRQEKRSCSNELAVQPSATTAVGASAHADGQHDLKDEKQHLPRETREAPTMSEQSLTEIDRLQHTVCPDSPNASISSVADADNWAPPVSPNTLGTTADVFVHRLIQRAVSRFNMMVANSGDRLDVRDVLSLVDSDVSDDSEADDTVEDDVAVTDNSDSVAGNIESGQPTSGHEFPPALTHGRGSQLFAEAQIAGNTSVADDETEADDQDASPNEEVQTPATLSQSQRSSSSSIAIQTTPTTTMTRRDTIAQALTDIEEQVKQMELEVFGTSIPVHSATSPSLKRRQSSFVTVMDLDDLVSREMLEGITENDKLDEDTAYLRDVDDASFPEDDISSNPSLSTAMLDASAEPVLSSTNQHGQASSIEPHQDPEHNIDMADASGESRRFVISSSVEVEPFPGRLSAFASPVVAAHSPAERSGTSMRMACNMSTPQQVAKRLLGGEQADDSFSAPPKEDANDASVVLEESTAMKAIDTSLVEGETATPCRAAHGVTDECDEMEAPSNAGDSSNDSTTTIGATDPTQSSLKESLTSSSVSETCQPLPVESTSSAPRTKPKPKAKPEPKPKTMPAPAPATKPKPQHKPTSETNVAESEKPALALTSTYKLGRQDSGSKTARPLSRNRGSGGNGSGIIDLTAAAEDPEVVADWRRVLKRHVATPDRARTRQSVSSEPRSSVSESSSSHAASLRPTTLQHAETKKAEAQLASGAAPSIPLRPVASSRKQSSRFSSSSCSSETDVPDWKREWEAKRRSTSIGRPKAAQAATRQSTAASSAKPSQKTSVSEAQHRDNNLRQTSTRPEAASKPLTTAGKVGGARSSAAAQQEEPEFLRKARSFAQKNKARFGAGVIRSGLGKA